jgi:hypothetical protein
MSDVQALDLAEVLEVLLIALAKDRYSVSREVSDAITQANDTLDEYRAVTLG